jgi:hypothetical protein
MRWLMLTLLAVPCSLAAQSSPKWTQKLPDLMKGRETYAAVLRGRRCAQVGAVERRTDCEYRVGKGLEFVIAGVGEPDAGITIVRANGYDGDYYATVGVPEGCVIVNPGRGTARAAVRAGGQPNYAFVSPRTGKVYTSWQSCVAA